MQGDSGDHGVEDPPKAGRCQEGAMKSTVDEIRQRFDADVERFFNVDTA